MAVDFAAEGLLDGLEGDAREARLRLLEELEREGVPLEELRAACEEGRLALLPLDRALAPPGERFTFAEMAERARLEPAFLADLTRALGLPLPDDDEPIFTDADLKAAQTVGGFRGAGLSDEELLEVTRVLGHSLSQIVAALRSMFTQSFFKPGDSEYDVAMRWAAAAKELNPMLEQVVQYLLRAHQVAQLRQGVFDLGVLGTGATQISVAFADLAGFTRLGEQVVQYLLRAHQVAQLRQGVFDLGVLGTGATQISVAFADLAGFTRLGEQVPADQLGRVAGRLTALAIDKAQPPVRLVKMIGDAAMLVSSEPRALLESVLGLLEAVEAEGEEFPPLRAGIACGVGLSRGGDWFGAPVNLASRITDKTRPSAVVVSAEFKDLAGDDGYRWTRLPGKRKLKGISDDQVLFRVRRPETDADS